MELSSLLSIEVALIAVIVVAVIVVVVFTLVANKISAVEQQMADMAEGMDRRLDASVNRITTKLQEDMAERSQVVEHSLAQMGDSWHNSLNRTLADVRGEIGKLQGELTDSNDRLSSSLVSNLTDHAAEVSQGLATVRDTNHQELQSQHDRLLAQVRDHAAGEHEAINASLATITEAVKANLAKLSGEQTKTLLDVTGQFANQFTTLTNQLDTTIGAVSTKVTGDLDAVHKRVATTVKRFDKLVSEDLSSINQNISGQLASMNKRLEGSVTQIAQGLDGNLSRITTEVNDRISASIGKLDSEMSAVTGKLGTDMEGVTAQVSTGMEKIGTRLTVGFDAVEESLNQHLHREIQGIIDVFRKFAGSVHAIETTQDRIEALARDVSVLVQALDDRRARGALGEVVLSSIVGDNLAAGDYQLNARLPNGVEADCVLRLPQPTGDVAVNARLPVGDLEVLNAAGTSDAERDRARQAFHDKLAATITSTAADYIVPGQTADGAILLLPTESAFSEAHVNHRDLVELASDKRVWLASPSTLIAMVTVARAVIKDSGARQEVEALRGEMGNIVKDYTKVGKEVRSLYDDVEKLHDRLHKTRKAMRAFGERLGEVNERLAASPALEDSREREEA